MKQRNVPNIWFSLSYAVHVQNAFAHMYTVTGYTRDPFDKVLAGVHGIMKNDDVAAFYRTIRHDTVPNTSTTVAEFVHQQVIANQERVFHGFGRNLKCLHHKCNYENGDHHGCQERLQGGQPVRLLPL